MPTTADYFGDAVAVSGNTVVVGSPYSNNSYGSAYVFIEPASGWTNMTQVARLTASSGAAWSNFGLSVAIDGNTIVVGADSAPGNNSYSGAAYVFSEPASGWTNMTQTSTLTASDGQSYDGFGVSVAVSGNTVVVGADGAGTYTGAAYVYSRPAAGWTNMSQTAKLAASDGTPWNRLGVSVAISGNTVVVGADHNGSSTGAAYVYAKPAAGWANMAQSAKLTASDGQSEADFGLSVAVSGNTSRRRRRRRGRFPRGGLRIQQACRGLGQHDADRETRRIGPRRRRRFRHLGGRQRQYGRRRRRRPRQRRGRGLRLHRACCGLEEHDRDPQADCQRWPGQ